MQKEINRLEKPDDMLKNLQDSINNKEKRDWKLGLNSFGLIVNCFLFYRTYKQWKTMGNEERIRSRQSSLASLVEHPQVPQWKVKLNNVISWCKRYEYHISCFTSSVFLIVAIYFLVSELKELSKIKEHMKNYITYYQEQEKAFDLMLKGTQTEPTEEQKQLLSKIMKAEKKDDVITFNEKTDIEAIKKGYRKLSKELGDNIKEILDVMGDVYNLACEIIQEEQKKENNAPEEKDGTPQKVPVPKPTLQEASRIIKIKQNFDTKKTEAMRLIDEGKTSDMKKLVNEIRDEYKEEIFGELEKAIKSLEQTIISRKIFQLIDQLVKVWLPKEKPSTAPEITDEIALHGLNILNITYKDRATLETKQSVKKYMQDWVQLLMKEINEAKWTAVIKNSQY